MKPGLCLIAVLVAGAVGTSPCAALAQSEFPPKRDRPVVEQLIDNAKAPLVFRRIFVPADRPDDWPVGKERYLPIDEKEFARLLEVTRAGEDVAPGMLAARVMRADYEARLANDDMLVGQAVFDIVHSLAEPALMPLDPCAVAITSAVWQDTSAETSGSDGERPAIVGNGPDGLLAVVVPRSGRLVLKWSLHGQRNVAGTVGFAIKLPSSVAGRLVLDLPGNVTPEIDRAFVSELPSAVANTRRWRIDLGGRTDGLLRLTNEEARGQRRDLTLLRQADTYEISPHGLDLTSLVQIDVHGDPLTQLDVRIDPTVQIVGVRLGDKSLLWTVATDPQTKTTVARIEFVEALTGTGRTLQINAVAPLVSGQLWRMPGIHPNGLFWQEGTISLLMKSPFVLRRLQTHNCRETRTAPLTAPQSGEVIDVQCFAPEATVELEVDRPADRLQVNQATRLGFFSGEIVANTVADVHALEGGSSTLVCEVGPQWQIDSVDAQDAVEVVDWDVEGADPHRRLLVRLDHAIAADRPLRLKIAGRRATVLNDLLRLGDLTMLTFRSMSAGSQRMLLEEPDAFDLQITGTEELTRVDVAKIASIDPLYSDPLPRGIAFEIDAAATRVGVTLAPRKPRFTSDARVDLLVQEKVVTESCRLRCQPSGAVMDRVLVHLSQAREGGWQWAANATMGPLAYRRLSPTEQLAAGAGSNGEVWEISWRNPQREAFEIVGTHRSTLTHRHALALAALPEAANQTGTVAIRVADATGIEINNRHLVPLPVELNAPGNYSTFRGIYRYDPTRDGFGGDAAIEIAAAASSQEESGAWVWNCELDSRYSVGGVASHVAVFHIQTAGQSRVTFAWPVGATPRSAWVDSKPLGESQLDGANRRLTVDLPVERQLTTVSLYFVTHEPLPRLLASYSPQFPEVSVPLLERRWRVWLPSGYVLSSNDLAAHRYSGQYATWSQRLFGLFGRGPESTTLNPLLARFWSLQDLSAGEREAAQQLAKLVVERIGAAGSASEEPASISPQTWTQLLADDSPFGSAIDVRIDRAAVDELNIAPSSVVPNVEGESAWERGLARMHQANLALLVSDEHVLITSSVVASLNASSLTPLNARNVYYVHNGPLNRDMLATPATQQPSNLITLAAWTAVPAAERSPWTLPEIVRDSLTETRGWQGYQFEFSDQSSSVVTIKNQAATYSVSVAILIFVLALGVWRSLARRTLWVVACGTACAAAMVLPSAWSWLAGAVFVGGTLSWLWLARSRSVAGYDGRLPAVATGSSTRLRQTVSATILLAMFLVCVSYGSAQPLSTEANEGEASESTPVARVLVPINAAQRHVGDKLFLPETFYRALYQRAAKVLETPSGWIITKAKYRAVLARQVLRQEGIGPELRASIDLQVFQRNTVVRLPIAGEGMRIVDGSLLIDGRAARFERAPSTGELVITIDEPGAHRIDFEISPSLQIFGTLIGLDLNVPAVSQSEIELTGTDVTRVEIPTALGGTKVDKDRGHILANLGGVTKLIVRWPEGNADGVAPTFELDELLWAKIRPGSMVIDLRLNVRVAEGRLRQLRLITDPRLRLLSPLGGDSTFAAARTMPGDPQSIDLELSRPIVDQGVLDLKFVVVGASGVGNLRLPRCEVAGVRATRRWLAVSVDSALESREETGEDLQPLAIPEFATAWGDGDAKPQSAYRLPRGESSWVLSTRPRGAVASVDQTLTFGVGPNSSTVEWEAELTLISGYLFQVQLQTPVAMNIDRISVKSQGMDRLVRWSRDTEGIVTIFLAGPVTGSQQLVLRGRVIHPETATVQVPSIRVLDAELNAAKLLVFRAPSVIVDLKPSDVWQPQSLVSIGNNSSNLGRMIASLKTRDTNASAILQVSPNRPSTTASQVTTVGRDNEEWWAEVDVRLRVQGGIVDALHFDIPPHWTNIKASQPSNPVNATIAIEEIPGQTTRHLVVHPAEPVSDQFQITLRGKIAPTAGDRLRVPESVLRGISSVERYVLLPNQVELQQVAWEMSGLSNADLPSELQPISALPETHTTFHVLGEKFQASLKSLDQLAGEAKVKLAEIRFAWQWDGRCSGVATFDLEPAGLKSCVLEMPNSFRPIQVAVANVPIRLIALEPGRWRVNLASPQMPQRIELVFAGTLEDARNKRGDWRFIMPALAGIETMRTLWSVVPPSRAGLGVSTVELNAISPARYELYRLESAAELATIATDLTADQSKDEAIRGYRSWWERYEEAMSELQIISAARHDEPHALTESTERIQELNKSRETNWRHVSAQLQKSAEQASLTSRFARQHLDARPLLCFVSGKSNAMKLRFPRTPANDLPIRLLTALAILGVTAFTVAFLRRGAMPTVSTALLAAGVGAVWWWALQPAFAGTLLLAMSVFAVARHRTRSWHSSSVRADKSARDS